MSGEVFRYIPLQSGFDLFGGYRPDLPEKWESARKFGYEDGKSISLEKIEEIIEKRLFQFGQSEKEMVQTLAKAIMEELIKDE